MDKHLIKWTTEAKGSAESTTSLFEVPDLDRGRDIATTIWRGVGIGGGSKDDQANSEAANDDKHDNTENAHEYYRHITISRDQTGASSFEKDKLAVLHQNPRDSGKPTVIRGYRVRDLTLSNSPPGNVHHYPVMDGRPPEHYPASPLSANDVPVISEGQSNDVRIVQLEEEIQKLRDLQNSLKSTSWHIIHKIQDEETSFLATPSWTLNLDHKLRLRGNVPVADEASYLRQRLDVAFVIYKHYNHDYQSQAVERAKAEGSILPDPAPVREAIHLLSRPMIAAVDAFTNTLPTFKKSFPDWNSNRPIDSPFLFWYHYRSEQCVEALSEPHRSQMQLLTDWIDQNYDQIYTDTEGQFARGRVSRSTMPFFVRPGEVIVSKDDRDIKGYIATSWCCPLPSSLGSQPWSVEAWSYGYDGRFYRKNTKLDIDPKFDEDDGEVDIASLGVLPLRFLDRKSRAKLDHRGRVMWACRHSKLVAYTGELENDLFGEGERYMIDFNTYKQLHSDSPKFRETYPYLGRRGREEMDPVVMECDVPPQGPELFALPSTLVGYNLRQKKWRDLKVDLVQDVVWNKQSFKHLVIDEETKDLVQALVTSNLETEQSTDLIQGKGNGLIILLHGNPGTGKTFTAESVAEIAQKPLFRVTCGDIGTKPEEVEKYLESVLHLGKIWGCVVLLDEADVFLEQRTLTDLERNALVSVFLRVLEYYEGILILTSNRVGTFDEAFKSRIQLSLHYEALDKSQRRKIWSNFLDRLNTPGRENPKIEPIEQRKRKFEETKGIDFDDIERHLAELAEPAMNGRQIRNAITIARKLAKFKGESMGYRHLERVIKTSRKFDKYLEQIRDNFTDDEMAREDGIR